MQGSRYFFAQCPDFCRNGQQEQTFIHTEKLKSDLSTVNRWLESEDGKILKQTAGKPVYTATLVKYAELICNRPFGQGMLSGIEEY